MKREYFETHEDLCDYMVDKAQDGIYTVAVLFYEDALQLLRELMQYDDIDIEAIEIKPEEYDGYDKEYYVSLTDDMFASVEPAYVGGRYLSAEADLTLIDGDASSAIIKDVPQQTCCEIYIGVSEDEMEGYDDDYCENELDRIFEEAELVKDEYGKVIGMKIDATAFFKYLFG